MGGVKGDVDQWRRHVPSCSDKELKENVGVGGILFLECLLVFGTVEEKSVVVFPMQLATDVNFVLLFKASS